jgi:Tol biopolymer transport system component
MKFLAACLSALVLLALATTSAATDGVRFGNTPAWSPDGKSIAFIGGVDNQKDPDWDVWVMNADGTNAHQLTQGRLAGSPTWSPDSKRLAFDYVYRIGNGGLNGIAVMYADGTGFREIVHNGSGPAWSPGGRKIVFSIFPGEDRPRWLWAVDPDGSSRTLVASHGSESDCSVGSPTWSPDGQRVAFWDECLGTIGVVRQFGGRIAKLVPRIAAGGLDWSPGGRRIAYASSNATIWVLDLKTGRRTALHAGTHPSWSPNSRRLAFADRGAIYVMNADGTEVSRLYPR